MKKHGWTLVILLLVYFVLIASSNQSLEGDEFRYLRYASDMVEGSYTDANNPDLTNGPGYPIVLLPFVAFNIPLLVPKLLNGIFVFIGILYFYQTLKIFVKQRYALIFSVVLGVYPPLLRWMTVLYSEALSFMLICGIIYYFCLLNQGKERRWKNCVFASFFLGFLILTKVIFFYVLTVSAILLFILMAINNKAIIRWSTLILIGSFVFILPYVVYAYSVTEKLFYLGNRGGEILYHRSTPYENELGNWFPEDAILGEKSEVDHILRTYQDLSQLRENHHEFYSKVQPLTIIERDSAFKAKAIENMKAYPVKYMKNTVANTGRFLFNYPFSYRSQSLNTYGYLIPNMFIIVLLIFIAYPALLRRKKIPFEIWAILIFGLIYGGGTLVAGGASRYFTMLVPFLAIFLVYCYTNILKISVPK